MIFIRKHLEVYGSALKNAGAAVDFFANNNVVWFEFKGKITGQTGNDGTNYVQAMVALTYLSNIWRPLEMPLIICDNNHILAWPANCLIISKLSPNICNNPYKTLCLSCKFINSR